MNKSQFERAIFEGKNTFRVSKGEVEHFVVGKSFSQVEARWKKWKVESISIELYLENTTFDL